MKLPEELIKYYGGVFGARDSYYNSLMMDCCEAIVRDCSKVCFDEADKLRAVGAGFEAEKFHTKACAMLARYEVVPK